MTKFNNEENEAVTMPEFLGCLNANFSEPDNRSDAEQFLVEGPHFFTPEIVESLVEKEFKERRFLIESGEVESESEEASFCVAQENAARIILNDDLDSIISSLK